MSAPVSDALVVFGVTGDLAYKQIFASLLGLVRDEGLNVPIIGVAKAGWNLDQLKERAKDSLAQHGPVDAKAEQKLLSLLRYVDGDYADPSTFDRLHGELGDASRALNYLAVPPSLFGVVAAGIAKSSKAAEARLVGKVAAQMSTQAGAEGSVAMRRVPGAGYKIETFLTPLSTVAKETKHMDPSYLSGGNNVTQAFLDYARPLVGALPVVGTFEEMK